MNTAYLARRLWVRSRLRGVFSTVKWARSGVRIHPSVRLGTSKPGLRADRGTKISERCRILAEDGSGIHLEHDVWLAEDCVIEADGQIHIGAHTTVQRRVSIIGSVDIGKNCILAPNIFMSSGAHPIRRWPYLAIRDQERLMAERGETSTNDPITIGDDCWLGVNVVVSPGVSIGQGAVVGANAVVTKDVAPYSVVAGSPARQISQRLPWIPPTSLDLTNPEALPYISGAETVIDDQQMLHVIATKKTMIYVAAGSNRVPAILQVEVSRRCSVIINGSTVELSRTGYVELTVPQGAPDEPIRLDAPLDSIRLLNVRLGAAGAHPSEPEVLESGLR